MPPIRSENLLKMPPPLKNRKDMQSITESLRQLYIDVNDPRNNVIIKHIQMYGNAYLNQLFYQDSKNNLN